MGLLPALSEVSLELFISEVSLELFMGGWGNLLEAAGSCQPVVNFVTFERASYRSSVSWVQQYIIPNHLSCPSPPNPRSKIFASTLMASVCVAQSW